MARKKKVNAKGRSGDPRVRHELAEATTQVAGRQLRGPVGDSGDLGWLESRTGDAFIEQGLDPDLISAEQWALFRTLSNVLARVRDHMRRMDEGLGYAVDDLAVALRVLLHTGRGGHLLTRAANTFEVEMPDVIFSAGPLTGARFSVGSIPIVPLWDGIKHDTVNIMPITDWLQTPVVRMRINGDLRTITWVEFIALVANKLGGAHSDSVVPEELDVIDRFSAGGLALSGFLLQQVGFIAWHWGQRVLRDFLGSAGMDISDEPVTGPPGSDLRPLPEDVPQGWLFSFAETDDEVLLHWYVDETSDANNLRLLFFDAVWDFQWGPDTGLSVTKPDDPHERQIQVQRSISYADVNGLPDQHVVQGQRHYWYTIRTIDDLKNDRPWEFSLDHNPWVPGPGWTLVTPDGREIDASLGTVEFGVAAGLLIPIDGEEIDKSDG
jgi:hypothetical protein